jgi:hypothetical protein
VSDNNQQLIKPVNGDRRKQKQRTWKKPNQKTSIQQVEYTFTLIKERCQPLLMVRFEAESPLFP